MTLQQYPDLCKEHLDDNAMEAILKLIEVAGQKKVEKAKRRGPR
jgi:hypothetical protein